MVPFQREVTGESCMLRMWETRSCDYARNEKRKNQRKTR